MLRSKPYDLRIIFNFGSSCSVFKIIGDNLTSLYLNSINIEIYFYLRKTSFYYLSESMY